MRLYNVIVSILILDFLWIYMYFRIPFGEMVEQVQGHPMKIRPVGAVLSYAALVGLAYIFLPKVSDAKEAFLLGFLVYGVFDATNYAIFTKYKGTIAIVDALWGGLLFAAVKALQQFA